MYSFLKYSQITCGKMEFVIKLPVRRVDVWVTCYELPAVTTLEKDVRRMEGIQEEVFVKGFGNHIIASIILNLSNYYIP
jgi:hypothetical protein